MDKSESVAKGGFTCLNEGCKRLSRSTTKPGKCGACRSKESYHRKNPDAPYKPIGDYGKWQGIACSMDGCEKKVASRGLCSTHYGKKYTPKKSSDEARKHRIKHRYGITVEQYEEMVKERGNLCDVCEKPPSSNNTRAHWNGKLCIDHCHDTGKVRGLLCNDCNLAVGYGKTPSILERAASYLRFHDGRDNLDKT